MSEPANTVFEVANDVEICREERCELLGVHVRGEHCVRRRGGESLYRTRSRRHATQPWRANNYEALHESVLRGVSFTEPRSFSMVLAFVENDYGSCCERSVHRHLGAWRHTGEIVRLDFKGRVHAYLREGSRLLSDPDLVLEQILDVHAEAMMWDEYKPTGRSGSDFTQAAYASA